jgi:hypothetical protein
MFYKRIFTVIAMAFSVPGFAQERVSPAQTPYILSAGSFNCGNDTGLTYYGPNSANGYTSIGPNWPSPSTRTDTVVFAAGANDSAWVRLVGAYNIVGFEVQAYKTGGRADSISFALWATMTPYNGLNTWTKLTTFNMTNASGYQDFQYLVNSGNGNPYTNYRIVAKCLNAASNSGAGWKAYLFVR